MSNSITNVDPGQLKRTANELAIIVGSVRAQVKIIRDAIEALDKGWKSDEAKPQFFAVWLNDNGALEEMLEQYDELTRILNETAGEFDSTEQGVGEELAGLYKL